jgi:hypothetical protein
LTAEHVPTLTRASDVLHLLHAEPPDLLQQLEFAGSESAVADLSQHRDLAGLVLPGHDMTYDSTE